MRINRYLHLLVFETSQHQQYYQHMMQHTPQVIQESELECSQPALLSNMTRFAIKYGMSANPILSEDKYRKQDYCPTPKLKLMPSRQLSSILPSVYNPGIVLGAGSLGFFGNRNSATRSTNHKKLREKTGKQRYLPVSTLINMQLLKPRTNNNLVYEKLNNSSMNSFSRTGQAYDASLFFDVSNLAKAYYPQVLDLYSSFQKSTLSREVVDDNLAFDSHFQCGNLLRVKKIGHRKYQLTMQNDTNSKGYTQWFYFKVKNRSVEAVTFVISSFVLRCQIRKYKDESLFEKGMKPVVCVKQQDNKTHQFRREGHNIHYSQANNGKYQLSISYQFSQPGMEVCFSSSFPYTYTNLRTFLGLTMARVAKNHRKLQTLCNTVLGYQLQMLTIKESEQSDQKEIIYVIGRQHPGESPSSFVIEGLVNALLSDGHQTNSLLQKYTFKIIPMANVDGVVLGNYRCNISGLDINRCWEYPHKIRQPEICAIKQQMAQDKNRIAVFLDIHAHSKKMSSFFYGSEMTELTRYFPFVCSRLNKDILFESSDFSYDPSKKSTARMIAQNELKIKKSYTFQVSFFGRKLGKYCQHFTEKDLKGLGQSLILGLFYSQLNHSPKGLQGMLKESQPEQYQPDKLNSQIIKLHQHIQTAWGKYKLRTKTNNLLSCSDGSDSDPECFQMGDDERQSLALLEKTKRLQVSRLQQHPKLQISCQLPARTLQLPLRFNQNSVLLEEKPKRLNSKRVKSLVQRLSHSQDLQLKQPFVSIDHSGGETEKQFKYYAVQLKKAMNHFVNIDNSRVQELEFKDCFKSATVGIQLDKLQTIDDRQVSRLKEGFKNRSRDRTTIIRNKRDAIKTRFQ